MTAAAPRRRRASKDTPLTRTLQELFRLFDKDGSGEIKLEELYSELSSIPGVTLSAIQKHRLKSQFSHMDGNRDRSVTYPEFEKAALAALSSDFSSLQKQREAEAFGYDFFTLLALSRRSTLTKARKPDVFAEFEQLKEMSRMSFLTLDMMEQERKKASESERIQRRTTVNFDQPLAGMASERAAVLARAHFTQTLRPESSERVVRAKKDKDDVEQCLSSVEEASRATRRKFKRRLVRVLQPLDITPSVAPSGASTSGPLSPLSSRRSPPRRRQLHHHQEQQKQQINASPSPPHSRTVLPALLLSPLRGREKAASPRADPPDSPISSMHSLGSSSAQSFYSTSSCTSTRLPPLPTSRILLPVLLPPMDSKGASNLARIRERRVAKLRAAGADYIMQSVA